MKKLLTLMLALCIALTMCSGALASRGTYTSGGVEFELTDEGYPVMAEPITVSVVTFATTPEGAGAWETPNDIVFFKNMKEKTNIDFTWEVLSSSAWSERVQSADRGRHPAGRIPEEPFQRHPAGQVRH